MRNIATILKTRHGDNTTELNRDCYTTCVRRIVSRDRITYIFFDNSAIVFYTLGDCETFDTFDTPNPHPHLDDIPCDLK